MSGDYSILLSPAAWSQLGRVDSTAYDAITRALNGLAIEVSPETAPRRREFRVLTFAIEYEVDSRSKTVVVHSVAPQT